MLLKLSKYKIDEFKNFDVENIILIEKSLNKNSRKSNTKSSFSSKSKKYSRRQDNSLSTSSLYIAKTTNSTYYDVQKNEKNRKVFFTIFCDANKNFWQKRNYYRAFRLAHLFTDLLKDDYSWRIPVQVILKSIKTAYEGIFPNTVDYQSEITSIFYSLPIEVKIDILTFFSIENFYEKISTLNIAEVGKISEVDIKSILKDFGLNSIPDTVLDIARKGYDKLRRRVYDIHKLAKKIFINHAAAAELKNDELIIKKHNLKKNTDPSRKFPQDKRRFTSSPLV